MKMCFSCIFLAGHLVRSVKAFRWRSGRQRHPGVQSGTASRLTSDDQLPEALLPLPDGLHTLRAERVRTEINRGEEPGEQRSPEQEREGIVRQGEERSGRYDVVQQDPEPPRTETDRPGPDMGRPAGWHPAGVHTAKHGQVTLHGTLHVSCEGRLLLLYEPRELKQPGDSCQQRMKGNMLLKEQFTQTHKLTPPLLHADPKSADVSKSTEQFWSFTAKQTSCSWRLAH